MSIEQRTSIAVYSSDLEWLKKHQLRISGDAGQWLTMPDVIRKLINDADLGMQDGIVMVPLIENPAAFHQRTAELRAQGFDGEADARDKFARRGEEF